MDRSLATGLAPILHLADAGRALRGRRRGAPWRRLLAPVAVAVALAAPVLGQPSDEEGATVAIDRWLVAGPVATALPAYSGETGLGVPEPLAAGDLLPGAPGIDQARVWPREGAERSWPSGATSRWVAQAAEGGSLSLDAGDGERPRLAWLVAYVETGRFLEAAVTLTSAHPLRVFVDGEEVGSHRGSAGDEEGELEEGSDDTAGADGAAAEDGETDTAAGEPIEASVPLPTGKHRILVAAVFDPAVGRPWTVAASLETSDGQAVPRLSLDPERGVTIGDLLDLPAVEGATVSADGELVAITLAQPAVPSEDRSEWVEIVRADDGAPVHTLRGSASVSGFAWAPRGRSYAYRTAGEEGRSTLWVGDLTRGTLEPLLRDVERLSSHHWAADARSLFVSIDEIEEEDERGAVRVRGLPDRWAGSRQRGVLWQVAVEDGSRRRLTAGVRPAALLDVAPDGSRLLLSRTDYTLERPFTVGELVELDLATLEPRPLTRVSWLTDAAYSPDGSQVVVLAGPSAFGEVGVAVPEGEIPNEYDGQLFLVGRDAEPRPLTREFDPAVGSVTWSRHDGRIYFLATDRTFARLYHLEPASGRITPLPAEVDVVDGLATAAGGSTLAYWGSSVQQPAKVFALGAPLASRPASRLLLDPGDEAWSQVRFGRVEDFDFTTVDGTTIEGNLYYPLDFDPERRYPLLVFYYGGVVPTDRSFGGRYPRNLWAANGYAVYVLQPSGAVGWGQELSARHVNDWGRRVSGEIQQGVREVLAAHPFLDGERVGNLGGSYGGFMTMLLIAESDQFAAAVSHAGISAIPSYWGEGWWGYLYNAVSAAGSYPWNRPDLYVEQSPLFAADRIDTPLLLLHGTADPNVPPGESDQMFAALRVLGKEVEYIRIEGEQHWILSYPKRVLWWQTILAWFDLHLKDEPEWWQQLWGDEVPRSGP